MWWHNGSAGVNGGASNGRPYFWVGCTVQQQTGCYLLGICAIGARTWTVSVTCTTDNIILSLFLRGHHIHQNAVSFVTACNGLGCIASIPEVSGEAALLMD